jgi:uncharacterized protein (TIGR02611 family)
MPSNRALMAEHGASPVTVQQGSISCSDNPTARLLFCPAGSMSETHRGGRGTTCRCTSRRGRRRTVLPVSGVPRFGGARRVAAAFFRWRTACHQQPALARVYRAGVALVGSLIVVLGVVLIPLPGPGWLIVFIGLSVLASEFAWAERLLHYARARVGAWTWWVTGRSKPVRLALGASGVAALAGLVLLVAAWQGFSPLVPTSVTASL